MKKILSRIRTCILNQKFKTKKVRYYLGWIIEIIILAIGLWQAISPTISTVDFDYSLCVGIVTTIVFTIISLLGISISIQNDNVYGIKYHDFQDLRVDKHISFVTLVIICIVLSIVNIIMCEIKRPISVICISSILVSTILFVSVRDFPILIRNKRTIFKLIKDNFILKTLYNKCSNQFLPNASIYDILFTFSTMRGGIVSTFIELEVDDYYLHCRFFIGSWEKELCKRINQDIIESLTFTLYKESFNLNKVSNDYNSVGIEVGISQNIKNILSQHIRTLDYIDEDNIIDYASKIEIIIKILIHNDINNIEILDHLFMLLRTLDSNNIKGENKKKYKCMIEYIVLSIITDSIRDNDLSLVKEFKNYFSTYNGDFNQSVVMIMSFISMQMYFLVNDSTICGDDLKQNIRDFISREVDNDGRPIDSWSDIFIDNRDLSEVMLNDFIDLYHLNSFNFEVRCNEAYNSCLTRDYVIRWYLAHVFSSHFADTYAYIEMYNKTDLDNKHVIKKISNELEDINNDIYDKFNNMITFYDNKIKSDFRNIVAINTFIDQINKV